MTACQDVVYQEQRSTGVQWDNMNDKVSANFTFLYAVGMIIFDGILYGFVAWYIQNVFPGDYETGKNFLHLM